MTSKTPKDSPAKVPSGDRIAKVIARAGVASRREAERLIEAGRVTVNGTVITRAATSANRANLAKSFLTEVENRYAGTRLGRQELDGELVEDALGALWPGNL